MACLDVEVRVLLHDMSLEVVEPANYCRAIINRTLDAVLVRRVVCLLVTSKILRVYEFLAATTAVMPLIRVVVSSMTPRS